MATIEKKSNELLYEPGKSSNEVKTSTPRQSN